MKFTRITKDNIHKIRPGMTVRNDQTDNTGIFIDTFKIKWEKNGGDVTTGFSPEWYYKYEYTFVLPKPTVII